MKRFKILDVKRIAADENRRASVYNPVIKKYISLPFPEFSNDCICIIANPIDLSISEGEEVVGLYAIEENRRTCYFIKPYSEKDFNYWKSIYEEEDDWVPFFPEQKEISYFENGDIVSFYKDISFNSNWIPSSHALYVNRVNAEHSDDIDYMDLDIDRYQIIDVDNYEMNEASNSYDVYANESFGEIKEDNCKDECWACAMLLQKEMFYVVEVVTLKDGHVFRQHTREVFGWDAKDAFDLALQSIAQTEGRSLYQSDISTCKVYHDGVLVASL